jgi:uncharacterized protein (TIGR00369 family)
MQNAQIRQAPLRAVAPQRAEGAPREAIEAVMQRSPFTMLLGTTIAEYGAGKVVLEVPVSEKLLQHHRFVHGAVIGALADIACGCAAASLVGDIMTSEYKVNLMAPATGSRLVGRGEVIRANARQVVCRADVFSEKNGVEKMVATALATVVRLRPFTAESCAA